jgi:hypothetical protein
MAFAATFAFAVAEPNDWEFSFFAPMLAVQMLAAMPAAPGIRQGIAIPIIIFVTTWLALAVSILFSGTPGVLLAIVGLVICWTFYGQRRGAPAAVMFLAQIAFCCVPVISTISTDLAETFSDALLRGSIAAVVTVWIAHLLFPVPKQPSSPAAPAPTPSGLEPAYAARVAISDTLILIPLLLAFIIGGDINNIVILIITLNLLREVEPERSGRIASGLLAGNVLGGALGVVAYQFVVLANNSILFFLLIVLATSLWFSGQFARGGLNAPVYAIAFATFLLILGLGVTPLPTGSEELFTVRILKIAIASAYAIGALSLVSRLRGRRVGPA